MKITLSFISKAAIYLLGLALLTILVVLLPELAREEAVGKVNPPPAYPYLIGAWILVSPIFAALYQAHRLVSAVSRHQAFSLQSIKALQIIKRSTLVFNILLILGVTAVIFFAKQVNPSEDVTPLITLGSLAIFTASIIAIFLAVLEKLLKEAIELQKDQELTI